MKGRLKGRERRAILSTAIQLGGFLILLAFVLSLAAYLFWTHGLAGLLASLALLALGAAGLPRLPLDAPPPE